MLHIGQAHPRGPIPGFPRDSAVLPRMSVSSGRAPMCRRTCSAHGRVSTVLNAGAFPHDSADPSPASPGRMCSTVSTRPLHASEPGGPVPTPRMRPRHRPLRPPRAQGRTTPHPPSCAITPILTGPRTFLVRRAQETSADRRRAHSSAGSSSHPAGSRAARGSRGRVERKSTVSAS